MKREEWNECLLCLKNMQVDKEMNGKGSDETTKMPKKRESWVKELVLHSETEATGILVDMKRREKREGGNNQRKTMTSLNWTMNFVVSSLLNLIRVSNFGRRFTCYVFMRMNTSDEDWDDISRLYILPSFCYFLVSLVLVLFARWSSKHDEMHLHESRGQECAFKV